MMAAARAVAVAGLLAFAGVTVVYARSLAGVSAPAGALIAVAFPVLVATGLVYIWLARTQPDAADLRWWMPVLWVVLIANDGVVWQLADRATAGGHVERVAGGRAALVVHGRVVRELDPAGVQAVAVWDTRQLSSHLLVMLALTSLGVVALLPARRTADHGAPAP